MSTFSSPNVVPNVEIDPRPLPFPTEMVITMNRVPTATVFAGGSVGPTPPTTGQGFPTGQQQ